MRETIIKLACDAETCRDCHRKHSMGIYEDGSPVGDFCDEFNAVIERGLRCRYCVDGEKELARLRQHLASTIHKT